MRHTSQDENMNCPISTIINENDLYLYYFVLMNTENICKNDNLGQNQS